MLVGRSHVARTPYQAPFDDPEVCGEPGEAAAAGRAGEPPPASYGAESGAQGMAQGGGAAAGGAAAGGAAGAVYLSVLAGPDSRTCVSYSAVEPGKLLSAWREGGEGGEGGGGGGGGGRGGSASHEAA